MTPPGQQLEPSPAAVLPPIEQAHTAVVYDRVVVGPDAISLEAAPYDLLRTECDPDDRLAEGMVTGLYVARERGYCGGVKAALLGTRALRTAVDVSVKVRINRTPTHGADSTAELKGLGVDMGVPVEDISPDDVYVISAHGAPGALKAAKERGIEVYDTTCIFVHNTHREIERCAQVAERDGIRAGIIYLSLGGRADHPELVGSVGLAQDLGLPVVVVSNEEEIVALADPTSPLAGWQRARIISQTTNEAQRAAGIAEAITEAVTQSELPVDMTTHPFKKTDICRTVTDRQNAVQEMVELTGVEVLVVVGALGSENTRNLSKVAVWSAQAASSRGSTVSLQRIILVNSHGQLPRDIKGVVGIVSGASTDDRNVDDVIAWLNAPPFEEIGFSDKDKFGGAFPPVRGGPSQDRLAQLVMDNTE